MYTQRSDSDQQIEPDRLLLLFLFAIFSKKKKGILCENSNNAVCTAHVNLILRMNEITNVISNTVEREKTENRRFHIRVVILIIALRKLSTLNKLLKSKKQKQKTI